MKKTYKIIMHAAAVTAAVLILAASGFSRTREMTVHASASTDGFSPFYYAEEGGQDDTSITSSDEGSQQDTSELLRQYTARVKAALDDLESHARAMINAGNAGNREKYDSEQKVFDESEKKVGQAIDSFGNLPYDDVAPITDNAYDRLYKINKLREHAETALANSLGGAMDESGNIYPIKKVSAKVRQVGKSDAMYDAALQGLGPSYKDDENHLVYKISLFVGKKPVHLIGGLTKSVTIGIPGEQIGRSPVTSYYLWDEGDGNGGAPVAEKRGYFDKSTWCLTVKVSKYVTYYVVCGKPGSKGEIYGDDVVATQGKTQQFTVDELRAMISAVLLDDGNEVKAKALEAVNLEGKSAAVYEISLPEDITLLSDAEAIVDILCPETAKKAVEIYRISDEAEPIWEGTYIADEEGKLQIATDTFGVFVLSWQDEAEEETPVVVVTPTDAEPTNNSAPIVMAIIVVIAAVFVIGGVAFLVLRKFKK